MSARPFGMHHRTVVPENFERPEESVEDLDAESETKPPLATDGGERRR
ncbi:hypothetical protein [Halomarina rubra]|uniref:Uncharacterized protein n=1 Tax=Halomarina rubra TaxID=2071873 RepID=A0ABD6AQC9_9EURY|nr:hypothetical protein [Halomarina rubra]